MILEIFYYYYCGCRCYCHRRQRVQRSTPTPPLLPLLKHEKQKKTTHLIVSIVRCHYFGTPYARHMTNLRNLSFWERTFGNGTSTKIKINVVLFVGIARCNCKQKVRRQRRHFYLFLPLRPVQVTRRRPRTEIEKNRIYPLQMICET